MTFKKEVEKTFMETRYESLINLLYSLAQRGIRWSTAEGHFAIIDGSESLTEGERIGIDVCRESLYRACLIRKEAMAERIEDHVPTLTLSTGLTCRESGEGCRRYSEKSLRASHPSVIMHRRQGGKYSDCGECDLACVAARSRVMRMREAKKEATRRARERANRFSIEMREEGGDEQDWVETE